MMWESVRGQTVYLDSNIIIFAIESGNRWQLQLRELFGLIDDGDIFAVTSEITLAEVLVRPLSESADDLVEQYELVLNANRSPIEIPAVTRAIIRSAADVQAELGIKLIDAIHVATARLSGCPFLLTNDFRLGRKLSQPTWLRLEQADQGSPNG
jgi:predicted nucleic acid-binding protein